MMTLKKNLVAVVVAIFLLGGVALEAGASSGSLLYHTWSSAGIVIQKPNNGNTIALWQSILNSSNKGLCIDGAFGTNTRNATISWQGTMGVTADGVVGANTWNATQNATSVFGPRLQSFPGGRYSYYGGGSFESWFQKATWSGVYQWGFYKPETSTSGTLHSSERYVDTVSC